MPSPTAPTKGPFHPMHDPENRPVTPENDLSFRTDRVENPQQYSSWRDYAFSDESEPESTLPR
jgi:hypothetical protein